MRRAGLRRAGLRRAGLRRLVAPTSLAALLGLACASNPETAPAQPAPVQRAKLDWPALVAPPSGKRHVGKVIFAELVTPDLVAAERFYDQMFGWRFRDIETGVVPYAEASVGGRVVAGLVQKPLKPNGARRPAWLTFISARDVDAVENAALQRGAKALFPPHEVGNLGREAVLEDPQGAVFAVLASSSGDPPDLPAATGQWVWSSLITPDPDAEAGFYQSLFDYEVFEAPNDVGGQHLVLASDSFARASDNPLPPDRPEARAHWLNYVRVDDVAAAAAKAASLGGRVLVEPRADRDGGRIAVVADPLGAPFGLLEWPDGETVGDAR